MFLNPVGSAGVRMPFGAAPPRGLTTSNDDALRVMSKDKYMGVDLKFIMPSRMPKYRLYLKGVVDAEGSLLSPAVRRLLGDVHGQAGSPSI